MKVHNAEVLKMNSQKINCDGQRYLHNNLESAERVLINRKLIVSARKCCFCCEKYIRYYYNIYSGPISWFV